MNNIERDGRVLEAAGLVKTFREGQTELTVLNDVTLHLDPGERVAVVGS